MSVHEEYMREPSMDRDPYPMPPVGMPGMPPGMPGMQPPIGMPPQMPGMCPPIGMPPQMPGMCPPIGMPPSMPVMGEQDLKELCYMEHMHESMAYMCKAEACRMRAMQCIYND
ncbi:hypothetical protein [Anaerophilus nitritogenes]|uniref:hypothetical protein n=1 Tax=Anaerophilus nitritogenes TaxID=2498136 RepID=UPI00101BAD80|nr:hypothetical protein [Anaerophilus nitritogenes]